MAKERQNPKYPAYALKSDDGEEPKPLKLGTLL
jgi:hypothetical protein